MLEIRGIWLCHMSRWDRYVLRPRVRAETSGSETVPHIGPYTVLNHFDMTSSLGDDSASNDLLHDYLVKPVVACPSKNINVSLPVLGWFNDEHCKSLDMNKSFTYICKLSCTTFISFTFCDDHISLFFMTYESYSYIHVLHV